jgi:uncharacterized protein (TIGR02646 family)
MKYIAKHPEPQDLLDWKNSDKMYLRGLPKWNRIPRELKESIREKLMAEQGYICCYCERVIEDNDCHIEHIKPKGMKEYEKFLADYDNLLCSCQLEIPPGEPRHCGTNRGSWYDEALFITPLQPQCESRFKFSYDGYIEPALAADDAANITIKRLNLQIDKLNALRKAAIDPFLDATLSPDELAAFVAGYLVDKAENNGRFSPFYTTIKYLFSAQ